MSGKPGWRSIPIGVLIPEAGTTAKVRTGDWRAYKPILDQGKCRRCLICWIYCPDGAIRVVGEPGKVERVEIDYYYCKGCGICAVECPVKAITMVPEGE